QRPTYLSERSNCGQPKRGNAAKGGDRGYDAAKRTKGRKRHIVVDVLGLILAVAVTGANVQDRDGGQLVLKGLKDRFPRLAWVWADGVYAGRLVGMGGEDGSVCARYRLQTKGINWLFRFAVALDRGANLRLAGQLPSPRSGLRDQSTHERGLDQNRHDPPYGAKARLSILRQVLRPRPDHCARHSTLWYCSRGHKNESSSDLNISRLNHTAFVLAAYA